MVATVEPTTEIGVHPLLAPALAQLAEQAAVARHYEAYYAGVQRATFDRARLGSGLAGWLSTFRDNLCAPVVDAVADRLQVVGVAGQRPEDEAAAMQAWEAWQINRMDRRAGEVQRAALTAGDSYVVVWPDPTTGAPRIDHTPATRMTAGFAADDPSRLAWALKVWSVMDWTPPSAGKAMARWRVTLYLPDMIRKYISAPVDATATTLPAVPTLQPFEVEGEAWPLPNPYGVVPVVHVPNNAGVGEFGRSELTDLVPLQDALNKVVVDSLVGAEWLALPQRWVTGLQLTHDDQGNAVNPYRPGVDKLWVAEDPNVAFGQFPGADLSQLLALQNDLRMEFARISGVPAHYFMLASGGWPSGESLKTAEARFVAKVRDRQASIGGAWEQTLNLCLIVSGRPAAALEVHWQDPEPRNEEGQIERQLDVLTICTSPAPRGAREQMLRELGYSDDQVLAMLGPELAPAAAGLLAGLVGEEG